MCGISIFYVMSQTYSIFHGQRTNQQDCALKFEAEKYFSCISIDTTIMSLQMKIFAQFFHFYANFHLCLGSPST